MYWHIMHGDGPDSYIMAIEITDSLLDALPEGALLLGYYERSGPIPLCHDGTDY
jgi:hypothetical protein